MFGLLPLWFWVLSPWSTDQQRQRVLSQTSHGWNLWRQGAGLSSAGDWGGYPARMSNPRGGKSSQRSNHIQGHQLCHSSGTLYHLMLNRVFVPQNSNFLSKLILCHRFSRTVFVVHVFSLLCFWFTAPWTTSRVDMCALQVFFIIIIITITIIIIIGAN